MYNKLGCVGASANCATSWTSAEHMLSSAVCLGTNTLRHNPIPYA